MRRAVFSSLVLSLLLGCIADGQESPAASLKLEQDVRLSALLGPGTWEASGIELVGERLVVVLDDDRRLVWLPTDLSRAALVGEDRRSGEYEGIAWDPQGKRVWVVAEEARAPDGSFAPVLTEYDEELRPVGQPVRLPLACSGDNKGIEGLAFLRRGGREVLLCLYEGNHAASKKRGKERGNGRIAVLGRTEAGWEQLAMLELPTQADFEDYAGLDVDGDRLAVVSQASAKVWIGRLDPAAWKVVDAGRSYALPPGFSRCEGIAWLDARRLAICSDKAKPDEDAAHDQSVHVFSLPE